MGATSWLHDAVYDARASDNEEKYGERARENLGRALSVLERAKEGLSRHAPGDIIVA